MPEQELKLHVPPSARAAVGREVRQGQAQSMRLRALYFDTPDRELARARVAVRLRQEGRRWVQTLKAPGENAISRIEIDHERPGPVLDLSVYAGTEVEAAIAGLRGELGVRYETDVSRVTRRVRTRRGTVEIAWDTGRLKAGGLELPISEIEFELVSGKLAAVFDLARRWQQRHGLVADARSKSERGDRLAQAAQAIARAGADDAAQADAARAREIAAFWAPRGACPIGLKPDMTPVQALDAVSAECLDQIVRNAAVLAEVDTAGVYAAGRPEHVHQLRVGMRRLRSAWKLFDGLAPLPPPALREQAREYFGAFGTSRDLDVLREEVLPSLVAAGMPRLDLPAAAPEGDVQALAAGHGFQAWLLALQAWHLDGLRDQPGAAADARAAAQASGGEAGTPAGDAPDAAAGGDAQADAAPTIIPLQAPAEAATAHEPDLRSLLVRRLRKWHKQVAQGGAHFATLDTEARHALRKRAKRLRYGLSFAESLLRAGRLRTYRKRLAQLQDVLGEFNDLVVAREQFSVLASQYNQAWFALGWMASRLDVLARQAEQGFARLAEAPAFWK